MVATSKRTKFLIIEDDRDTATTLSDFISQHGFETVCLNSRDDGAKALENIHPDVILMDYWMPGMTASVFARRVRNKYPATKIIVVTADALAISVAKVLDADGYFGKPLNFDRLERYLDTLP